MDNLDKALSDLAANEAQEIENLKNAIAELPEDQKAEFQQKLDELIKAHESSK